MKMDHIKIERADVNEVDLPTCSRVKQPWSNAGSVCRPSICNTVLNLGLPLFVNSMTDHAAVTHNLNTLGIISS